MASSVLKATGLWSKSAISECSNHSSGDESVISTSSASEYESDSPPSVNSAVPREIGALWSQPDAQCFHVRSKNYLKDGKKNPSEPYLFTARGLELFLTEDCPKNVAKNYTSLLGGQLRTKPTFVINFRFPWGVLLLYFEIPNKYVEYMNGTKCVKEDGKELRPAEQCICNFLAPSTDEQRNSVFKFIPIVSDGPWVVRNMVVGKPVLIGQKLPLQYYSQPAEGELAPYLEADLDVGNSSARARNITSMCKKFMKLLTLDFGFVIQGDTFQDLPEQMLGCLRLHSFDPTLAPKLPDH